MGFFHEIDFRVALRNDTSTTETLAHSLSAGQLYEANGNSEPADGAKFFKYPNDNILLIFEN